MLLIKLFFFYVLPRSIVRILSSNRVQIFNDAIGVYYFY